MDTARLEQLLSEGKLDDAKAELSSLIGTELTDAERGRILLEFAEVCLDIETDLNERSSGALDAILAELRELDVAQEGAEKHVKLADMKKDILGS